MHEIKCSLNKYVKGLGFQYQESTTTTDPYHLTDIAILCGEFKGDDDSSHDWKAFEFNTNQTEEEKLIKLPKRWLNYYSSDEDMGICGLQTGHVGDATAGEVGIQSFSFKICWINKELAKTMNELIFIGVLIFIALILVLVFFSGAIYRACCYKGNKDTPGEEPVKQTDATANELADQSNLN